MKQDRYFADSSVVNLCVKCETTLKAGNFFVRKTVVGANKAFRRCDFCHRYTYCGQFEVSRHKTERKQGE